MGEIITAVLSFTGMGLICAAALAVFSRVMSVEEDTSFLELRDKLPGLNCGVCGYPGCDAYASALLEQEGVETNLCVPGGDSVSQEISDKLGRDFENVTEHVASVNCCGDCHATSEKAEYQGLETCAAVNLTYGGAGKCSFGCIGLGDCVSVCPSGAVHMKDGIAQVAAGFCTGCGLCARQCPREIISLIPDAARVVVACVNENKGAETLRQCRTGCIACMKCEKVCPEEAITVFGNLARIDYDKCTGCGLCVEACPVNCIIAGDFTNMLERR